MPIDREELYADVPPGARSVPVSAEDQALIAGDLLSAARHRRHFHFDDYAGGDGAFTLLLAMYADTARGRLTAIGKLVDVSDVPMSTTLYILNVLIAAGHVERRRVGQVDCYVLAVDAEEMMRRYLIEVAGQVRAAGARLR